MNIALLLVSLAALAVVLVVVLTFAPVLVWADRRQSAMIQDRIGPVRAGIRVGDKNIALLGLLHPLADALKFMWKEDFIPPKADKLLHSLAPIISVIPAIAAFAVIPFSGPIYHEYLLTQLPVDPAGAGRELQVASINVGILFVFAVGGTGVIGAALAGYCSNNKFALLGGLRAAGQMVSYEVTLGLSLIGCFMVYNTLLIGDMVAWQIDHVWGIFVQPLGFILFFTAAIAETKRIPFDVPEGESELAAGYFTEYSGMKFGMFMMGEYIEIVASSCILVTLFFGGYDVPLLQPQGIGLENDIWLPLPHIAVIGLNVVNFLIKVVILCWLTLMIRWSLPRFRYDQIMKLCWKMMLPLSLVNIFVTGLVLLFLQN